MKAMTCYKRLTLCLVLACSFSCKDSKEDPGATDPVRKTIIVNTAITSSTTWEAKNEYVLEGLVAVEHNTTLTIEPGTIIKGDKATKGTLVVVPGSRLVADGTPEKPIVFTSSQAKGQRNRGDWGGIILMGKAPVNKIPAVIEGRNLTPFGGFDAEDDSGVLRYVRIEFAGADLGADLKTSPLTFAGIGSKTQVNYVQVSDSGSDGFQWLGGTVNAKHLVSYRSVDDDFEVRWGFTGVVQYAFALRDPALADPCTCSDSNGILASNDATGSNDMPRTSAEFANVSIFMGPGAVHGKYRSGILLGGNSAVSVYNTLLVGAFPAAGLELDASVTEGYQSGLFSSRSLVFVGVSVPFIANGQRAEHLSFRSFGSSREVGLNASYNLLSSTVKPVPAAGSLLLNSGITLATKFEVNSDIGAFKAHDWTDGWTNFEPENTSY